MVEAIQLWRYPVKSMQGEVVEQISLTELGVAGDRTWATRDLVRGGIRGAKQLGGLMSFAATHPADAAAPVITFPDGSTVAADAPDASERLSAALDHPVRLEPLAPAEDLDHYRRGPADDPDPIVGLRTTLALEPDEPLPDLSIFPPAEKANLTGVGIRTGVDRTTLDPNNPSIRWFGCTPEAIAGRPGAFQCAANSTPFSIPGEFEFGKASQFISAFRQTPVFTENISITKRFNLNGDGRIRFVYSANIFNLFNRTNFGVNGTIGNADFGKATGPQVGARAITMGGRLEF